MFTVVMGQKKSPVCLRTGLNLFTFGPAYPGLDLVRPCRQINGRNIWAKLFRLREPLAFRSPNWLCL
jgi:hypothetical protein